MRQIEQKMIDFLDKKLAGNGSAQEAIKLKDARSLFIYAMEACVGIRESGGNNRGPMVKLIQETIGVAQGEPWCMSLIQTGLAYAEKKTGKVSPIAAGNIGEHCLSVWASTPKAQRVKYFPLAGAIIIWQHGTSQSGHTGIFVEGADPYNSGFKSMVTIEGNTDNGVDSSGDVVREGGGVYQNKRSMTKNGSMKVVGFLKPFTDAVIVPATPPTAPSLVRARWPKTEWTDAATKLVSESKLLSNAPKDWSEFFKGEGTVAKWVYLLSCMAELESGFDPNQTYKEKFPDNDGNKVVSTGLLQLSQESARGYGFKDATTAKLKDPAYNLRVGVGILQKLCLTDGRISGKIGGKWKGGARYWAVLRDPKVAQIKNWCRAFE